MDQIVARLEFAKNILARDPECFIGFGRTPIAEWLPVANSRDTSRRGGHDNDLAAGDVSGGPWVYCLNQDVDPVRSGIEDSLPLWFETTCVAPCRTQSFPLV